jgi:hypothetical protein
MDGPAAAQLAAYVHDYTLRGQHTADRALTRYSSDLCKMVEDNEISTGPGRYRLAPPNAYGNAVFAPNPTVRVQRWGASHDMTSTKTDVESDLWNISRPTTRTACGQYAPEQGAAVAERLTAMPEADFPQTHARLVDPPCTLRGTGWNRWEWLCQNPQENVMMPFEWHVDTRAAHKDARYHAMDRPLETSVAAREHQMFCGQTFVAPTLPSAHPPGAKDVRNFSDAIPGASQAAQVGLPPPSRQPNLYGLPPVTGRSNPLAPPMAPSAGAPLERQRAETGLLEAPTPFAQFIQYP